MINNNLSDAFAYRWVKLPGTDLLPGDIVSIGRSSGLNGEDKSVPADMLILAGTAIVNEAILTGESTPQWKVVLFSSCLYDRMCLLCRHLHYMSLCLGFHLHLPFALLYLWFTGGRKSRISSIMNKYCSNPVSWFYKVP